MPKIREIIELFNASLQAGNFKNRKMQDAVWYNLATQITRQEGEEGSAVMQPVVIDNEGEGVPVAYDDTHPLQFYHRLLRLSYDDEEEEGFGNPGNDMKETAEMTIICIGSRARINAYPEEVAAAICANIPQEIPHSVLTTLQLQSACLDIGDVNTDAGDVFSQEYSGVAFNLPTSHFMLSVKYTITTIFSESCFTLCQN